MNDQPANSRLLTSNEDPIDLILVDVIEKVSAQIKSGATVDFSAVVDEHPECAERLRKLLPTLEVLADLSNSTSQAESSRSKVRGAAADYEASLPIPGILGDYRIVREVGRGGMGIVYEAEQLSLKRRVALKVLPFAVVLDPRRLQRFKNEAQAAAALRHPHIVQVFAIGCERGVHYYAMEYVEGQTVAQAIAELAEPKNAQEPTAVAESSTQTIQRDTHGKGDLAGNAISSAASYRSPEFLRTVAKLGIQAAEALEHAHRLGIVHRDIKPSNLLLDTQGLLFVTDYGLAMTSTDANLTLSGDMLGTVRYMSPEQVQAKHQVMDHRTDVYSLGVTLYEMLTLQPAFGSTDRQQLMRQIIEDDPPRPRQLNPAIPRDVETIVLKAVAKEPRSRYATAEELAKDLQRFLTDIPIRARRPSWAERARKWARRHRGLVWAGLVFVVVAACVAAGFSWSQYQRQIAIEQHLSTAKALTKASDYGAAKQEMAAARARFDTLLWRPPSLTWQVASLSHELDAKMRSQQRHMQFRELRHLVHSSAYTATPEAVSKLQDLCRKALALYDVLGDANLENQMAFELLSSTDQQQLREAIAELLFLLSSGEMNRLQDAQSVSSACREALELLQQIEPFYRPLPAVQLWLAVAHEHLGDEQAAQTARQRSEERADIALDDYIRGEYEFYYGGSTAALTEYERALLRQPSHYLSLIAAGLAMEDLKRWDAAHAMFTGAVAAHPGSLAARLKRAGILIRQRKFSLAEMDLDEADRISPDDASVYSGRAWLFEAQRDRRRALEMLKRAEQLCQSPRPGVFRGQGNNHFYLHEYDQALRAFSRAVALVESRPNSTTKVHRTSDQWLPREWFINLYVQRGLTYRSLDRHDEAAADFQKAITFSPISAEGYQSRGIAYVAVGQYDLAAEAFRQAIQDPSEEVLEHDWLSHAYLNLGEWEQAIVCFDKQLETHSDNGLGYQSRALAQLRNGDTEAAVQDVNRAIELAPDVASYYVFRARVRREQGRVDLARANIDKSIQLDPSYTLAFCYRALLRAQSGHLEAAQEDLAQTADIQYASPIHPMLDTQNTNEVAWFLVTCSEPRLRRPKRALQLAQQLVQRKSNQPSFWTTLGVAQYRTGDFEAARETLEKMAAIRHGRRGHVALFLAMTCQQLGDPAEARRWYGKGMQWIANRNGILKEDDHLCAEAAELIGVDEANMKVTQ